MNIAGPLDNSWTFADFFASLVSALMINVRKRPVWLPTFGYHADHGRVLLREVCEFMTMDLNICSRARLSRDPRFDGKFFIGVLSTRIYCRSVCPVPTVKEKNVRYFATAAEAAETGYRPCLRCRPECAPGTPAWRGTSSTVSRGLRLITESGLHTGGMEDLAERLGVGPRHLRRLFIRHLGAPPSAVVQTRRLHFAKKLIDETGLTMSDVALASGFGCVRRFNAAIRKTYKRTPTQIRHLSRQKTVQPENQYLFQLRFRPPYHWQSMLAFLAARAIPGIEAADIKSYRRTISVNGSHGEFEVSLCEGQDALAVRVQIGDARLLYQIIERVRGMFDLNADWAAIGQVLGTDPGLSKLISEAPGLRIPGCWSGLELAMLAVLGQQSTAKRAAALAGRVAMSLGQRISDEGSVTHLFPASEILADARLVDLGISERRAKTIRLLARAVCQGKINFERTLESDTLLAQLSAVPGVSRSGAHYVVMRTLGNPDAWMGGDPGLACALNLKAPCELDERAEAWRPWRSYAGLYLRNTANASQ